MDIRDFMIETTRRCNFRCDHCLRGDAQNIDLTPKILDAFFTRNHITGFGVVTFSGGEPALCPEIMHYFLEQCKRRNITIESFYIVTNGSVASDSFLAILVKLYAYCDEKDACTVRISNDQYHQNEVLYRRKAETFKAFTFLEDGRNHIESNHLIPEGRAKFYQLATNLDNDPMETIEVNGDGYIEEGYLYLNAKGDILTTGNLSFHRQGYNTLGNVMDTDLQTMFNDPKNRRFLD